MSAQPCERGLVCTRAQVQMRDLKGFVETRRKLVTLKPNNRNNWLGYAMVQHGNATAAATVSAASSLGSDHSRAAVGPPGGGPTDLDCG